MRILVTGANGYLGQGVVKQLLDDGCEVIAADIRTDNIDKRAETIECDVFSVDSPMDYFGRPDVLLHMAWRDGFVHNSEKHIYDIPMHYEFINKMLAGGLGQIAVMGTMHEIGFYEGCIDENTACNPMTYYGIAKNTLRCITALAAETKGCCFQWLRGFYIVGNQSFGSSIFSKIYSAEKEGKAEFPFTTGQSQYDFIDYADFCAQVAATVQQRETDGIINICSGKPEKLCDRVESFIRENGYRIKLAYGAFPERKYDSKAIWGNCEKISKIMAGYRRKVIVTGANGQLGYDVMEELKRCKFVPKGADIDVLDITDSNRVAEFIREEKPYAVVHCAAWTAVDSAEENADACRRVNVDGTRNVAKACRENGCKLVYISTDYVFNGRGDRPWEPEDKCEPLNVYGMSKCEGELAVRDNVEKYFIVRISWLFGEHGNNFFKTMLRLGKENKSVRVVSDQIGSPTYTVDLAKLIVSMIGSDRYGIYHASNEGFCSWYELACETFRLAGMTDVEVHPVTSGEFPAKAKRPFNSRMSKDKLVKNGFDRLRYWQEALADYISRIK